MANYRKQKDPNGDDQGKDSLWKHQKEHTKWKARIEKLKALEMEGRLVDVEYVRKVWENVASAFRSKLLALPNKMSPFVLGAKDLPTAQAIIKQHVYEAIDELSRLQLEGYGLTTDDDRERVGRRQPPT
jgi:hypothetical protein